MSPEREAQLHAREQGLHRVAVAAMRAAVEPASVVAPIPMHDARHEVLAAAAAEVRAARADHELPSPGKIVDELRALAERMEALGAVMDYAGGFGPLGVHGRELVGAAAVARSWADGLEAGASC